MLKDMGKFELQVFYARAMTRIWDKLTRLKVPDKCASPTSAPAAGMAFSGRTGACRR